MSWNPFKKKKEEPIAGTFLPFNKTIELKRNESILQAALKAGLPFPHTCKVGTCGSCKSKLLSGEVKAVRDFSYILAPEEIKAGYILACQALPKTNIVVEVEEETEPLIEEHIFQGVIANIASLTHDILMVTIHLDKPLVYMAGQYAELTVPGVAENRAYSFASACPPQGKKEVEFFIRHVPGGQFTDWLFAGDRTNQALQVKAPLGHFHLHDSHGPMILVAGGSGLAPIKAILEEALAKNTKREAWLFFGVRTKQDLYGEQWIQEIAKHWQASFHYTSVLSSEPENSGWTGARGLVTEHIRSLSCDFANAEGYLCGPPLMVDAAIHELTQRGMPLDHIFYDKFLDTSHLLKAEK
jgi:p-cymene monooxygenase electron transfer component